MKNLFDHLKVVSKKKYDKLKEDCRSYRNNFESSDRVAKRCIEENHRLQDEVRKLHDDLIMERNRKPRPIIVKKELCYSFNVQDQYIEAVKNQYIGSLKNQAKKELLHEVETFIHEEELDSERLRFSIALFPIEDKNESRGIQSR